MSIALTAMDAIKKCRSIYVQCDGKWAQLGAIFSSRFIDAARDQGVNMDKFNKGGIVGAVRLHSMKHLQSTEDYTATSRLQEGAYKLLVQPGQTETLKGLP